MGAPVAPARGIRIAIDRGGTFTDCIASVPGQDDIVIKLLSVDPNNYPDAPVEAIRRVLEKATRVPYPKGQKIDLEGVESIKMGTTVATNALLERKGTKTAFVVTKGFKDLLTIGNQSRPKMFDLAINRPEVLHSKVIEISERVTLEDWTEKKNSDAIDVSSDENLVEGITGEIVRILQPIDVLQTRKDLQAVFDEGYRSIAVSLMHSYTYPLHEQIIGSIAADIGFTQISLSSVLTPMCKIVPRGHSANADAYLTPEIRKYIEGFESGFKDLRNSGCRCEFMQSDGGLVEFKRLSGLRAVLSGPAGGVIGYSKTSHDQTDPKPVIGFDMGGTSTDVSRYAGSFEHIFESVTAGIVIQSPQLDINTVAAGGGSILTWSHGMFMVGPESAGSHPGPACYRKGGPLTITDANLVLGRILPEYFPKIFGPNEDLPLDVEISKVRFMELTERINADMKASLSMEDVALGYLTIGNEAMCRPIRTLTEARGHDTAQHNLASFGGAGGQHATSIAKLLGINRVVIHRYSSILSAYGMSLADVVREEQIPSAMPYTRESEIRFEEEFAKLEINAMNALTDQGIQAGRIVCERYLNMRYRGSDTALMIELPDGESDVLSIFAERHHQEFGFTPVNGTVLVDDVRIRAVGKSIVDLPRSPFQEHRNITKWSAPTCQSRKSVYFSGTWQDADIYELHTLPVGSRVIGPALIIDATQTIMIEPECTANILSDVILIDINGTKEKKISSSEVNPIQLSIFGHRFMGIAEQMGRALQKTSVSTNIKERLDFSCTIFSPDGSLVANAPHVPAMIGSMAYAVKWQINHWGPRLKAGDVILTNSPVCGGVHLPDLTTITPVFDKAGENIIFWTASRGHHADVGGILPGSMPPNSRELWEEGAIFEAFKVVEDGIFKEDELTERLMAPDIRAQIAANHRGAHLIRDLISDYGMDVVQFYMQEIQKTSECAVRSLLKEVAKQHQGKRLHAVDYMDDGSAIHLKVEIDQVTGGAVFDFTGTGKEVYGNWNAPIAITHSSILFALRCMVGIEIPLNQGAIRPIEVRIPDRSLLQPGPKAACCAGNVLTSQRIVDTIFLVFGVMAASQGCMNNFCFGSDEPGRNFGYYETICGGSGAGPFGNGTSGIHSNMTNTRITDPEILERRYPVILRQFSLRPNSGGGGLYQGGNGVIRDVEFSMPMTASILSERRTFAPYGLEGGSDGSRGLNTWIRTDGSEVNIGGKNTVKVAAGDRIVIESPGGGGWGSPDDTSKVLATHKAPTSSAIGNGSVGTLISAGESA